MGIWYSLGESPSGAGVGTVPAVRKLQAAISAMLDPVRSKNKMSTAAMMYLRQ